MAFNLNKVVVYVWIYQTTRTRLAFNAIRKNDKTMFEKFDRIEDSLRTQEKFMTS